MDLYLHRANCFEQLERAHTYGWGVEIDVRSHLGRLFLHHDAIEAADLSSIVPLAKYLEKAEDWGVPVILDMKESNLAPLVRLELFQSGRTKNDAGVFDGLVATDLMVFDQLQYEDLGIRTLTRMSCYEQPKGHKSYGFWHDYSHLGACHIIGENIFLVSSELHGVELTEDYITAMNAYNYVGVCTDYPNRWMHR